MNAVPFLAGISHIRSRYITDRAEYILRTKIMAEHHEAMCMMLAVLQSLLVKVGRINDVVTSHFPDKGEVK